MPHRSYRRTHFFINKPLQLRYMAVVLVTLLIVTTVALASIYFGIWGSVLREFSDESIRNAMIMASRMYDYETARRPPEGARLGTLALFKETEVLSQRQREIFKEILARTNKQLAVQLLLLLVFIGWGTIYLSHKIAGPLYRFDQSFKAVGEGFLDTRIHLRKHDEASGVAESFNHMVESLDTKVTRLKSLIASSHLDAETRRQLAEELAQLRTSARS